MANIINLPVSIGEGLDKLTILDIKMKKIKDERLNDVKKEYDILNTKLENYKINYYFFYNILMNINENIWNMQDIFRETKSIETQNELCKKIISENDNRFRVKKKINNLTNSELKEQKGYHPKVAFVQTQQGLGDNICAIGMIRYLSTQYDKVIVPCRYPNKKNMELFYSDDNDIILTEHYHDKEVSPNAGCDKEYFKKLTNDMDLYMCGGHRIDNNLNKLSHHSWNELPICHYKDVNININYFWKYFYIANNNNSKIFYLKYLTENNYIFIHNKSSTGEDFSMDYISKKFNIDKNITIFINPDINYYSSENKFYNIAKSFLNLPIIYYVDTIINANKIFMTDSCFFCLALNLPIVTKQCYYKGRNNKNYQHMFKNIELLNSLNKPIFKQFN